MATLAFPPVDRTLRAIARAQVRSTYLVRMIWVEQCPCGRVVLRLAHKRGSRLLARVIGMEVL